MRRIIFPTIALVLIACEQEELPLAAPVTEGEVIINSVNMTETYADQVWFDLGTNTEVSRNLKTDWDISFDASDSSNFIYLNSGLAAKAAISPTSDFNSLTSTSGLTFKSDHQTGIKDSLAIGNWENHNKVIVIDRGYTPKGKSMGMIKIQFLTIKDGIYSFKYAKLDGSDFHEATVAKNDLYNRIAYSFTNHNSIQIEPLKTAYDICFTQYTHIFYDPINPYLVTGVLLNPYRTKVAEDRTTAFKTIDLASTSAYTFSTDQDAIGYEWKYFDLNDNTFTIYPEHIFILNDNEGYTYKLHFLDFYDDNGIKGTPTFEFKRL